MNFNKKMIKFTSKDTKRNPIEFYNIMSGINLWEKNIGIVLQARKYSTMTQVKEQLDVKEQNLISRISHRNLA